MGGLGDSLLTYPVLEVLSRKGYEITIWGYPAYFELAKALGFCHKTAIYEPDGNFDIEIIFSGNRELFSKRKKAIFVNPIPHERVWVVDYYLKKLNLEKENYSKRLYTGILVKKVPDLCVIHPGSGSKKKNPHQNFFLLLEEFLKKQGYKTVFLLGPAEKERRILFKNHIYLEEPLKSSLYIGLDSGVSHLASYLGLPSLVIFGPSDPFIWHPIGEHVQIIRTDDCVPCFPEKVCEKRFCLDTEFLIKAVEKNFYSLQTFRDN